MLLKLAGKATKKTARNRDRFFNLRHLNFFRRRHQHKPLVVITPLLQGGVYFRSGRKRLAIEVVFE